MHCVKNVGPKSCLETSNAFRGTTVSDTGMQIFGFHSTCGSIIDMCFRLLGVDGLPHARQSMMVTIRPGL